MLLVILFALVIVIGIALVIIGDHSWSNWPHFLGFGCITIGGGVLLGLLAGIAIVRCDIDVDYQNNLERREMIVYRLENQDDNLVGNELLYQEIRDFNEDLRYHKKWANNPWLNWFYNEKNATFDYIDYKGANNPE